MIRKIEITASTGEIWSKRKIKDWRLSKWCKLNWPMTCIETRHHSSWKKKKG